MKHIFKNKKVLITGHTGFKGSWLSLWMSQLGAKLYGISLSIPTSPSHFELLNIDFVRDERIDISESQNVRKIIEDVKPDFIFHLAAQAIVKESYYEPLKTWETNVIGLLNLLESISKLKKKLKLKV